MYQHTQIIGNLGRDPEMRYTPSGIPVCNFSVAVNERWANQNGEAQERTTWFRVTAWRKLAEVCIEYLAKGRLVFVEGRIAASAWMPQDSNEPRATLELTARTVKFLGKRDRTDLEGPAPEIDDDYEIPF